MSDSFFQKKRKRSTGSKDGASKAGPSRLRNKSSSAASKSSPLNRHSKHNGNAERSTDIDDGDDRDDDENDIEGMDLAHRYDEDVLSSDEDKAETPAEARVRLARMYLDSLRDDEVDPDDADAAEADRQNISSRLQSDAATHSTHIHNFVADRISLPSKTSTEHIVACRGYHRLALTAVVISADRASFWTASKDGKIIRWRLYDGKMLEIINRGETSQRSTANGINDIPIRKGGRSRNKSKSSGAARRRKRAEGNAKYVDEHHEDSRGIAQVSLQEGEGHRDEVWALAASSDGRHLVSGGRDRRICVWAVESIAQSKSKARTPDGNDAPSLGSGTRFIKALGGHKDSITALRFRQGSHDLFSASADRTLKLFDISQLSYVETFFGHQEQVAGLDLLRGEVAVTAGSRDRTLRWWKVRDESQLVFRGGAKSKIREVLEGGDIAPEDEDNEGQATSKRGGQDQFVEGSIDAVAMIDEHTFLSGGDSGTISLWSLAKKKPIYTVPVAHGYTEVESEDGTMKLPRWITSLSCLPYGDVFASGSWDGSVKLWKLQKTLRSFTHLLDIPATGFVNALELVVPSRVALRRLGREAVQPTAWRRRGGLRGGPKRTFALDGSDMSAATSDFSDDETDNGQGEEDSDEMAGEEGTSSTGQEKNGSAPASTSTTKRQEQLIIVAAIGQEPTCGRWMRQREARNGALVIPLALAAAP